MGDYADDNLQVNVGGEGGAADGGRKAKQITAGGRAQEAKGRMWRYQVNEQMLMGMKKGVKSTKAPGTEIKTQYF